MTLGTALRPISSTLLLLSLEESPLCVYRSASNSLRQLDLNRPAKVISEKSYLEREALVSRQGMGGVSTGLQWSRKVNKNYVNCVNGRTAKGGIGKKQGGEIQRLKYVKKIIIIKLQKQ